MAVFDSSEGQDVPPAQIPAKKAPRQVEPSASGFIYGLSCRCHADEGLRYVGMTQRVDPFIRLREHLKVAAGGKNWWQAVYEWIPEHGEENISLQVIEAGIPAEQLRYRELCHIRGLRGAGSKLMNQDDFWWVDEHGQWQHTWPDWDPFSRLDCVSAKFMGEEFGRGIYPLTYREYSALFPGTERQSVSGLASFLTPEGLAMAALWRKGLPDLETARREQRIPRDPSVRLNGADEESSKRLLWAIGVWEEFDFGPKWRPRGPMWTTY